MKLAELTLAKLGEIDLNGVLVKKILVEADETSASFEINGMDIEFVIDNDGKAHATALILNDQTYTDAETLKKCTSWVDYVATVVKKVMSNQQTIIEESTQPISPVVPEFRVEVTPEVPTIVAVPEVEIEAMPEVPIMVDAREIEAETMPEVPLMVINDEAEESKYENAIVKEEIESTPKQPLPEVPPLREKIVEETSDTSKIKKSKIEEPPPVKVNANIEEGAVLQNRRIAEAFERGRREGYTESRKMNLIEVKKVRRRATIVIIILLLLLATVLGAFYILFGEYAGFYVPEFLQFFNNNNTTVPPPIELY